MKSLIIYYSDYKQNTEKIARIFADKLNAELINISDISDIDVENYDLIGFGSGVYRESLSLKLFRVGFLTNSRGGKSSISFSGLKALLTTNTMGQALNDPSKAKNENNMMSP